MNLECDKLEMFLERGITRFELKRKDFSILLTKYVTQCSKI